MCAPCNDNYTVQEKVEFFDDLADSIHKVRADYILYVMGDFIAKVGNSCKVYEEFMGPRGKKKNNNYKTEMGDVY